MIREKHTTRTNCKLEKQSFHKFCKFQTTLMTAESNKIVCNSETIALHASEFSIKRRENFTCEN